MRQLLYRSTAIIALSVGLAPALHAQDRIDSSGRLQQGDQTLDSGEFYDSYVIEARAGQQIEVRASSGDFDTYVIMRAPGGEQFDNDDAEDQGTNSQLIQIAPETGSYRIQVTSFDSGETGSYALRASVGAPTGTAASARPSSSASAQRHTGTLAQGDQRLDSGEFQDSYTIQGRAGQRVDISLTSRDFDSYLMLRGPEGSTFDNDDAEGEGTNSRLATTLPANGTYRLVVTSYQSGETGSYTLVSDEGLSIVATSGGGGGSGFGAGGAGTELVPDRPVNGQLAQGDPTLDSGEFFDTYTLQGAPGAQLVVEMQSTDVDTWLAAFGSGGYEVSNDDDASGGGGGTNSRLDVTMPDTGMLTIAATSYAGGETGSYTLRASPARGAAPVAASGPGRELALGSGISGTLASGDPRGDNSVTDSFQLRGSAGQPVRIALAADAFDPMLRLEGPGGFLVQNDDDPAGGTLNSVVDTVLPVDGTYRVVVASYAADGLGSYRLDAATGSGEPGPGAATGAAGNIALGQNISGTLADGDQTISSGELMDVYSFSGERGQRVTFDMSSPVFDTYLSLLFPGGGQEENDDRAGGQGTDSRLVVTLPETGTYQLVATSYQPGESGNYAISMSESGAADIAANPRHGSGRVFALSVGVADYERIGSLNLTDQDALKLTQTLASTGMLADQSVTLVNSDATRENFIAAVQQIAASIGPDDLFLLFFSGHGGKQDAESFMEQDGSSETIELFDAAITDFELSRMIEPIRARTLLVLDSCFSGGFDDLINSRVGRMGVFSSDSDLTSLVADKFEAGGYISHILQQAMEGRADANADMAITAGELSEYMRTTFYRITLDEPLETTVVGAGGASSSGYQHIVVNRGGDGMAYEEVLVTLGNGG